MAMAGFPLLHRNNLFAAEITPKDINPFRTPYKYGKLVLQASPDPNAFDSKSVDDPFVFFHEGAFHMLYIGFDGTGYQTGMAKSTDLVNWVREGCVARRDPNSKYTRYNVALGAIVRENGLTLPGKLKQVRGRYLCAWNAYPNAGLEQGAAVIGLAWSDNLLEWELTEPILFPGDGDAWEHGGLYRPNLIEEDGVFYLFYNAKTDPLPKSGGGGWHEQTGVATSTDLAKWLRFHRNPILPNGGPGSWDERFASNPFVVRHKDLWGMYYFGLDKQGVARELLALGESAYRFQKIDEIMIDKGAPGTIDETYAHKPCVIYHDGRLYHFYCAVSGKWPNELRGISVACSKPW
jgi:predicted GH43/DUF377 family glycosyl hydrolase